MFPPDGGEGPRPGFQHKVEASWGDTRNGKDVPGVKEVLAMAVRRMGAKNTVPGPDSIPGRAWVLVLNVLGARLMRLFDECMRRGRFPQEWEVGRLVLIAKPGRRSPPPRIGQYVYWMRRANC